MPPRSKLYGNETNEEEGFSTYQATACVLLMDTQREKDIGLASSYQYDAMTEGQCLISQSYADTLEVEVGDVIYLNLPIYENLKALIHQYNKEVAEPRQFDYL